MRLFALVPVLLVAGCAATGDDAAMLATAEGVQRAVAFGKTDTAALRAVARQAQSACRRSRGSHDLLSTQVTYLGAVDPYTGQLLDVARASAFDVTGDRVSGIRGDRNYRVDAAFRCATVRT
jgi:hypothetical protein